MFFVTMAMGMNMSMGFVAAKAGSMMYNVENADLVRMGKDQEIFVCSKLFVSSKNCNFGMTSSTEILVSMCNGHGTWGSRLAESESYAGVPNSFNDESARHHRGVEGSDESARHHRGVTEEKKQRDGR